MKNQYAGDLHDYRKLGILRILADSYKKIGVVWMLTENDKGNFGNQTSYLLKNGNNEKYKFFDYALYEKLREKFIENNNDGTEKFIEKENRNVKQLEDILNDNGKFVFFDKLDELKDISNTENIELLFFDPDDGIGKSTERHLSWEEFVKYSNKDMLIVQFIRYNNQIKGIIENIKKYIPESQKVLAIKGGSVVYFYIANSVKIEKMKENLLDIVLLPI